MNSQPMFTLDRLKERLSKTQIQSIARELQHDEYGITQLCEIIQKADASKRTATNAAWLLIHLPTESKQIYLYPRYNELVDLAVSAHLPIRRGLLLAILLDMPTPEEIRTDLFDFCLTHLTDKNEADSTRVYMIKLLVRISIPYPELQSELILHLETLPCLSPSITSARRQALRQIRKRQFFLLNPTIK